MSLEAEQRHTLSALLDRIVPASEDGRLPGAGALGLADFVEANLRERPELRPLLLAGLDALEREARARAARPFAELDAPAQRAVVDAVAAAQPAFLGPLIFQTYVGYYRDPRVLEALGVEARPPYPQGYEVSASDLSRLEAVRRRGPFYRTP